jgi:putative phosphoribosyl transferase
VPVASREALETASQIADEVVCLDTPEPFYAVSRFYGDFRQVEDDEVLAALSKSRIGE